MNKLDLLEKEGDGQCVWRVVGKGKDKDTDRQAQAKSIYFVSRVKSVDLL